MQKMIFLIICTGIISQAQWSTDPAENTRVTKGGMLPNMISDGAGGAYIVYSDMPLTFRNLWIQRVNKYGYTEFPGNGIKISAENRTQTYKNCIVPDGDCGIYILFEDSYRLKDDTFTIIYLQHIDSIGHKLYGETGLQIAPAHTDQGIGFACSDGKNGVYTFWGTDESPGDYKYDLWGQHIDNSGDFLWGKEGIWISDSLHNFWFKDRFAIPADSGVIFIVNEGLNNLQVQKRDELNKLIWSCDSLKVVGVMLTDLQGGVFMSGLVSIPESTEKRFFAQHICRTGSVRWGDWGVNLSHFAYLSPRSTDIKSCVDKINNTYYVWKDTRTGEFDVYLQKLDFSGIKKWEEWGRPVSHVNSQKATLSRGGVFSDESKLLVLWKDKRNGSFNIYSQQFDSLGQKQWDQDVLVSSRPALSNTHAVSDGAGGAIVCWYEAGSNTGHGIFAQHINRNGDLGKFLPVAVKGKKKQKIPGPAIFSFPNPFNNSVRISFTTVRPGPIKITIFDQLGKEVKLVFNQWQKAGQHEIQWDGTNKKGFQVSSGLYFCRVESAEYCYHCKILKIK